MSLENDRPEGFLGMLMALEGVSDGYTIIHGPTGCKYYPASVAEGRFPIRDDDADTRNLFRFASKYFFSQPRIPCTYLDMGKFITGGAERLSDLYRQVEEMSPSLIAIINSPGSSLVGENISAVSGRIPTVHIDHAGYSGTCADGYQDGILEILNIVKPKLTNENHGVNLVGLSILHKNWEDIVEDLSDLLDLCGIEVNCTIGAGWSVEDIENSASAELNILVYPEYGDRIARRYQEEYGIPFVGDEVPVGFDSVERWIVTVCEKLSADPAPALSRIRDARLRTVKSLKLMESYQMLPKGHTFSMYCDGSMAFSVTKCLYEYLGMIPIAVTCPSGKEWEDKVLEYARQRGIPISVDALQTEADLMITSGSLGAACTSRGLVRGYVEVDVPATKYATIRPEPPIGLGGTVVMIERILNIIASKQRFL